MASAYARVWHTGAGKDGGGVGVLGIGGVERTGYGSGVGVVGGVGVGVGVGGVGGRPQPRARRTQRRVTHNEKRYHSGSALNYCTIQPVYHIHNILYTIYVYDIID